MSKVLIVEDDKDLSSTLRDWLELENYIVEAAFNGQDALDLMAVYDYDLVILDVQLPDMMGYEICRRYRAGGGSAHVLMLTAKSKVAEKTEGFDAGADDYLTKPFHMKELAARLRSLMRRPRVLEDQQLAFGNILLDLKSHRMSKGGVEIHLQRMEFNLLEFLMRHPGQVFSVEVLLDKVSSGESDQGTMRALIKKLRDKIDTDGEPSLIKNVHGLGYKLER